MIVTLLQEHEVPEEVVVLVRKVEMVDLEVREDLAQVMTLDLEEWVELEEKAAGEAAVAAVRMEKL